MKIEKLIIFLFFIKSSLYAQDYSPVKSMDDFEMKFLKANEVVTSVSATFKECYFSKMLKDPKISTGKFFYVKPNKIRWEDSTSDFILLVDNENVRLQRDGVEVVDTREKKVAKAVQSIVTSILRGDWVRSSQDFAASVYECKTSYKVTLIPLKKGASAHINNLELIIELGTLNIKTLTILQKSGERVVYNFDAITKNKLIPDNYFTEF